MVNGKWVNGKWVNGKWVNGKCEVFFEKLNTGLCK